MTLFSLLKNMFSLTTPLILLLYAGLKDVFGEDVILKPIKEDKGDVGLVMIQGAEIKPDQYIPLMKYIQQSSNYSLWVGIPEYPSDTVEPLIVKEGIDRIVNTLQKSGMKTDKLFYAGHSLGGTVLQSFVKSNPGSIAGIILLGSFISRKSYNTTYPVPCLTIGGELDGLARVTRIMEGYYHQVFNPKTSDTTKHSPVVVIPGLSHMQFSSGEPPLLVKDRDLKPEITYDDAHKAIAFLASSFMTLQITEDEASRKYIEKTLDDTKLFLDPLMKAYDSEGSAHFKPPCNDDPPNPSCTTGCQWSEVAQQIMGGLLEGKVLDEDAFHPVYQIPVHLPKIDNNCSSNVSSCVLKTHTVSQCVYEEGDKLDTGYFSTSAEEIRCKMSSRQAIMEATGMKNVDFNKTDGWSICKFINQASYSWALNHTGERTLERFRKLGEELVFGEDEGPYNAGPLWIWNPLKYKEKTLSNGRTVQEIFSPMMRTPTDYWIKLSAGFHYCKLLSPARAMEWIYVDGLRMYDSLNNSTYM